MKNKYLIWYRRPFSYTIEIVHLPEIKYLGNISTFSLHALYLYEFNKNRYINIKRIESFKCPIKI